jgi:hypothetical protein
MTILFVKKHRIGLVKVSHNSSKADSRIVEKCFEIRLNRWLGRVSTQFGLRILKRWFDLPKSPFTRAYRTQSIQ